jgi:PTS system cellobiose-specific IIB component
MTTILIVCGAGASSTFLASRLRSIAASRGDAVTFEASSDDDLDSRLDSVDVLLVGAHLESSFDAINARAARHGVVAALLAPSAVLPAGAQDAYDLYSSLAPLGRARSTTN